MKHIFRPQPHRKFIALVLGLSLAVSGFSAAPARADDDVGKFIAGAVVLGLIGAAVNDARKDRKRDQHSYTHSSRNNTHTNRGHQNSNRHRSRPLPSSVARYDLPARCVKTISDYSHNRSVVSQRCLSQSYKHVNSLPGQCRLSVRDGHHHRTAYATRCLQKHGYRLVGR